MSGYDGWPLLRVEGLAELRREVLEMAVSISQLQADVATLTAAVNQLLGQVASSQATTVLDAADQASVDDMDTAVQQLAAQVTAALTPAPATSTSPAAGSAS